MKKTDSNCKRNEIMSLILAGGRGTRLYPLSTPENPKPFIRLIGGKSFLRLAYERARGISPKNKIYIATLGELAKKVLSELPGFPRKNLILEPMPRNTAPALAYAAHRLMKFGEDSLMAVFPADHFIDDVNKFNRAVRKAAGKAASGNFLITFGIRPESPSTHYGYVEIEDSTGFRGVHKVRRFTEKPDEKKARAFLKKGTYFWNSGMFVWRIDSLLAALRIHAPHIYSKFFHTRKSMPGDASGRKDIKLSKEKLKTIFLEMKPISIDYAVFEKADNCYMVELRAKWKDFGTWDAVEEFFGKSLRNSMIKRRTHAKMKRLI